MVRLLSVAAGVGVSNIYFNQPLLISIANTFTTGTGETSAIITATSIGYALGLLFVVPLGDVLSRRRLVVSLLALVAAGQAMAAFAPGFWTLVALSTLVSSCAVVAPLLVSHAASLANPQERGRVTGSVISGVLMGLLLARVGGGFLADLLGGWRPVYVVAAIMMVVLAIILSRVIPAQTVISPKLSYGTLLRSVGSILAEEPVVRRRCLYGFFSFASFSAFWTSAAFLLAGSPYHYSESVIGLFGLVGVVGAYSARVSGLLVDRGKERLATALLFGVILAGWGLMGIDSGRLLLPLVIGVAVLDLGVQGVQVTNLSVIYRCRPEARNRITTAYTATYFVGGVLGSVASGVAFSRGSWLAVCAVGALLALAPLVLWVREVAAGRDAAGMRPR